MSFKENDKQNSKKPLNAFRKISSKKKSKIKKQDKNIGKNIISISKYDIQMNPISNYNEDDYCSFIYDKPISKAFLSEETDNDILIKNKTFSFFKLKNDICFNKENILNNSKYYNFHYSFEEKIKDNIILDGRKNILKNEKNFGKKFIGNVNIFESMHKIIFKKFRGKIFDSYIDKKGNKGFHSNIKKINISKSKFSKKMKKNLNNYKNGLIRMHNRNATEIFIDLNHSKNKIIKIERLENNNRSTTNLNSTTPNNGNYKIYDTYIMNSNLNDNMNENEKENHFLNKSMKKNNTNLNQSIKDNINKLRIKSFYINYKSPNNNISGKKIPTKFIKLNNNNLNKFKKKEDIGLHKIIKKRVILEEEYMISPQGEKRLLSVKRLERKNNSKEIINSNILKKYFKNNKKVNKYKSNKDKHSLNSYLFSSIFKSNERQNKHNKIYLKSIDEDSQIMSNSSKNNNISQINEENSQNVIDNFISNPFHIKKRMKNNSNNIFKNSETIISNKSHKTHEQNIYSELNKEDINFKKKLFYNKIHLIKGKKINNFNKSNYYLTKNNTSISTHTNFLNTSRSSINYTKDKYIEKKGKNIYKKISFLKEQPLMIYHNENKSKNLIINNNQNFPGLVNIVFFNQDNNTINQDNNKFINSNRIPQPKISCRLKRSNYRFHEIKSSSINNISNIKSRRNFHHNKNDIINENYNNSCYNIRGGNNHNIYSSINILNNNEDKYFEICDYNSSINKYKNENIIRKLDKRASFNNNGISEYFIKYFD